KERGEHIQVRHQPPAALAQHHRGEQRGDEQQRGGAENRGHHRVHEQVRVDVVHGTLSWRTPPARAVGGPDPPPLRAGFARQASTTATCFPPNDSKKTLVPSGVNFVSCASIVRKKPPCVERLNVGCASSGWNMRGRPHSPMRLNSVKN